MHLSEGPDDLPAVTIEVELTDKSLPKLLLTSY